MQTLPILAETGGLFEGTGGLIIKLVVGGLIGWAASILMKTNAQMGLLANVVVGILGALGGHFLAGVIGIGAASIVGQLLIALGGAVLLIIVLRFLGILR
jgi:uncharacterized membrane protein YeaQ/YmgE (transglycosylase-associated protein family)